MLEQALALVVGAGIGGFVGATVRDYGFRRRLSALEVGQDTLMMTVKGQRGNSARAELESETEALMLEAMGLLKSGGLNQENAAKVLGELAIKYPKASMRLLSKGGLDLKGLGL